MKKRINKKGQELSIGTLILILIGVVILVLLILGFTMGFDFILDIFKLGPGQQLEKVRTGCNIAAEASLTIDFCTAFKEVEIAGKDVEINCQYPEVWNALDKRLTCEKDMAGNSEGHCRTLLEINPDEFDENLLVNGKSCADWGVRMKCTDLGGTWKLMDPGCDAIEDDKTRDVADTADKAAHPDELCCVPK
jgi:hypothetical protein